MAELEHQGRDALDDILHLKCLEQIQEGYLAHRDRLEAQLRDIYDSQVAFGHSRVLLVWTRLVMPSGRSLPVPSPVLSYRIEAGRLNKAGGWFRSRRRALIMPVQA